MDSNDASRPQNLRGHFLIAETELQDPNFFRTVVLVIHHNEEGAFGLVVNRGSEVSVGEVVEGVNDSSLADMPLMVGGPVQRNYVFALHSGIPTDFRSEHAEEPAPGIFFEPSFQHVIEYVDSDEYRVLSPEDRDRIVVYAGYSGWGPGQLEFEVEEEAWLLHPAHEDVIFRAKPNEGWKAALSKKGGFYRIVAETGYNPSRN